LESIAAKREEFCVALALIHTENRVISETALEYYLEDQL
jgi:hypothetical protein